MRRLLLTLLLTLTAALPAHAQSTAPAVVRILVTDPTGNPIVGADIAILKSHQATAVQVATGDRNGAHTFTIAVDTARYRVTARKLGFVATTRLLVLTPGDTTRLELRLASEDVVTQLPPVLTKETYHVNQDPGDREGFERRCELAPIGCLKSDYIDARHNYVVQDLLNHSIGMIPVVSSPRDTTSHPLMASNWGGRCEPVYYVNGFRWGLDWNALKNTYTAGDLSGVEVYPAGQPTPPRFVPDPGCGVIVFWTK